MKKNFIYLILLFFIVLAVSCKADAMKLYERGRYEKSIETADIEKHPKKNDYLAKAKSLIALDRTDEAKNSILMYLLSTDEITSTYDRQFAVDLFLKWEFTDDIVILCLVPEDGLEAQIELYKAYSSIKDTKNSRIILDSYLSGSLTNRELAKLLLEYPMDSTYITGIFESWLKDIKTEEKQEFSELLYNFTFTDYITEQSARSVIYMCQTNEEDSYFNDDYTLLANVYKTHARALEILKDSITAYTYNQKAQRLLRTGK